MRRVEAQKSQSAIIHSLPKTNGFDKIRIEKGGFKYNRKICKHVPKHPQRTAAVNVVPAINQDNAQHMGRSVQSVARFTISEKCA